MSIYPTFRDACQGGDGYGASAGDVMLESLAQAGKMSPSVGPRPPMVATRFELVTYRISLGAGER